MTSPGNLLDSTTPVPCPRCGRLFRLPDPFAESSTLACPHCNEEVTGKEISDSLVPTAKIVQGSAGSDEVPLSTERPSRHKIDDQDFVIPKPLKTARRRGGSQHPQRKSKSAKRTPPEKNTFSELIRIALGGLLAIPIAILILWWAFLSDPFGVAPTTSQFAPFLVPQKLRPATMVSDEKKVKRDMPETQRLNDNNVPITITPSG